MGQKEKLLKKLMSSPRDFTFSEAESLLGYFNYITCNKGKTSGSRVMFKNPINNSKIILHKPHPGNELPSYQVKQLISHLEKEGLL